MLFIAENAATVLCFVSFLFSLLFSALVWFCTKDVLMFCAEEL